MKIYARQISPEYQESPLFLDECFPDDIILTGNRDYNSHTTPEFDKIATDFDSMAGTWENDRFFYRWNGAGYDKIPQKPEYTLQELLTEYGFTRPDGKPWTTQQRHRWRVLMEGENGAEDESTILAALELLTGYKWESGEIRGSCQGDWQGIFYRADTWSRDSLRAFETEYFNEGSEWIVHDKDMRPESPEDITGFSMYCTEWREEDIAAAIAEAVGGKPEDVILYAYDGETRTAKYRKVG